MVIGIIAAVGVISIVVYVTVREPDHDAQLAGLTLNDNSTDIPFSPYFNPSVYNYTANVQRSETQVRFNIIANDPRVSKIELIINSSSLVEVVSSVYTALYPINLGTNPFLIKVTAEDNITVQFYSVNLIRAFSNDASLANLLFRDGNGGWFGFNPPFSPAIYNYTATVLYQQTQAQVQPTANSSYYKRIDVTTMSDPVDTVVSGVWSLPHSLVVGQNPFYINITAEDGITTRNYTVWVTRISTGDATLSNLTLQALNTTINLKPVFSMGNFSYTAPIPNEVTQLRVFVQANDPLYNKIELFVNNDATEILTSQVWSTYHYVSLSRNVVTIRVTARDTTTVANYTVTVDEKTFYHLIIAINPPNGGNVSTSTSDSSFGLNYFEENAMVTLNPIPATSYVFANWTGNNAGEILPGNLIKMNGTKSITANFANSTGGNNNNNNNNNNETNGYPLPFLLGIAFISVAAVMTKIVKRHR